MPWRAIADAITAATGEPVRPGRPAPVSGGGINAAYRLEGANTAWFIKLNDASLEGMFAAEAEGLQALAAAQGGPRIPAVIATGSGGGRAFLVLEWIGLQGRGDWAALGEGLAALHAVSGSHHGWHRDNTIGATPQINSPCDDWAAFFAEHRLGYQLGLAEQNGAGGQLLDRGRLLQEALGALFSDHRPPPSLLHGDLWSGNVAFDASGRPVLYDPATHFGDRECDLAMSELFGRFPAACYDAYQAVSPLAEGYAVRRDLYQLYHVLNHFNLFGGGYESGALRLVERVLAELGR